MGADKRSIGFHNDAVIAIVKEKFGYDDSLDAFGVHGIGGMWGAIATGLWATTAVNPAGAKGLFYGETNLFIAQVISIGVAVIFAVVGSTVLYKHGERGYNVGLFAGTPSFVNSFESDAVKIFSSVSSSQS